LLLLRADTNTFHELRLRVTTCLLGSHGVEADVDEEAKELLGNSTTRLDDAVAIGSESERDGDGITRVADGVEDTFVEPRPETELGLMVE